MSARIKNVATIRDKLVREKSTLEKMNDIAGVRVVLGSGRDEQDRLRDVILSVGLLTDVRIKDRRVEPKSGYRAVHIVGKSKGHWVEVQVRTRLQHDWAQMFERLADIVGRDIRYGQMPAATDVVVGGVTVETESLVEEAVQFSDAIADTEGMRQKIDVLPDVDDYREKINAMRQRAGDLSAQVADELRSFGQVLSEFQAEDASRLAEGMNEHAPWYLVAYDRRTGQHLRLQALAEERMRDAWASLEVEYRGSVDVEVVLLASNSLSDLRSTHGRYFTSMPGVSGGEEK